MPNWGVFFIVLCLGVNSSVHGQGTSVVENLDSVQIDIVDIIKRARGKESVQKDTNTSSLILVPIIGSNPATGFMFGVGGQYAVKMEKSTRYSSISGSVQFTTKGQTLFLIKNNIFTKSDKIFFSGDWRLQLFSQTTYGLGTNSPEGGALDYQYSLAGIETNSDSLAQPMKFNFIRFHQSMSFKLRESLYLGFGYNLDGYAKIVDEKLRLTPGDSLITSHYYYNTKYGYSTEEYYSSAITANVLYDSRDNMINPYKGIYANVSWRGAMEFLGSESTGNLYNVEWRSYHSLSKRNARHLLSFWVMGNFTGEGKFPYMILPATAYDQKGRSARGYTQGRFRGTNLVYGEAEYRFPISKYGGVWGGVLFVNATTANNEAQSLPLFQSVKPGYGFGFRLMIDKQSRTNLAIDIGFGEKSSGFYLAVSEAF